MAIYFKARKSTVTKASGESLYYPQIVSNSTVHLDEIASELEQVSAVSKGDAFSVLTNLTSIMRRAFLDGRSVHIDGIGTFSLSAKCSGRGVSSAAEVNAHQINNVHVCFREEQRRVSGKTVRVLTEGVRFVKAAEY